MPSLTAALARRPFLWAAAGIAVTSAGHYLTPPEFLLWHGVFQRMYYLPVVYAAIAYGLTGGLCTAAVAAAAYIPHIAITWAHHQHYAMEQYAEILMFFAVGSVTGVLSDLERKRREELQRSTAELRRVYRELQSTFEQVRRADRLAAVGQLAAGLTHEIRNPLASIEGAAEVLEAGAAGELRKETLGIIRQECARLNRLLTQLLDFARPREPELRSLEIAPLLDRVIELVRHSPGKELRLVRETEPDLPALLCDEEQITQVILNLAINAVQAMPEGGEVRLSARQQDGGILFQVRDQGVGVPPDSLDRIFDPFFTTKENGTGLGLAVVHRIVSQLGGRVSAEPNPDRGMTFSVWLPPAAPRASDQNT